VRGRTRRRALCDRCFRPNDSGACRWSSGGHGRIAAICDEIHQRSPATHILLLGIFPRGEKPDANRAKIDAVNERIARFEGRGGVVTYLDIGDRFLAADRSISKDLMYDFLHPTAKGYEVWATAMEPTLTRLVSH
jgi:lysophospholipase L1-like esterase